MKVWTKSLFARGNLKMAVTLKYSCHFIWWSSKWISSPGSVFTCCIYSVPFLEKKAISRVFCVLHAARSYSRRRGKACECLVFPYYYLESSNDPWNNDVFLLLCLCVCLFGVNDYSALNSQIFKPPLLQGVKTFHWIIIMLSNCVIKNGNYGCFFILSRL